MSSTEHFVRDSLLEGAASEQKAKGLVPDTKGNEAFIKPILEQLDRKTACRKVAAPAPPEESTKKPGAFERELDIRCRRAGVSTPEGWHIERGPKETASLQELRMRTMRPALVAEADRRLRKRLQFLRAKPEWEIRFKRINPLVLLGQVGKNAREKRVRQRCAVNEVRKILEDADKKFGEWWLDEPARPLWFGPEGTRATRKDF